METHLILNRQLSCDINVNNTLALLNTEMIKTYVAVDPRVRPLIMIIKHWTKQRFLNDAGKVVHDQNKCVLNIYKQMVVHYHPTPGHV